MSWKTVRERENNARFKKWEEDLNLYDYRSQTFTNIRLVLDPIFVMSHFISIPEYPKGIPVTCPRMNAATGEINNKIPCPACEKIFEINGIKDKEKKKALKEKIKSNRVYYCKAIIRDLQSEGKPYIKNVRIPSSVMTSTMSYIDIALNDLKKRYGEKNIKQIEKEIYPAHIKFGYDLSIKFNDSPKVAANNKYNMSYGGLSPLTRQEVAALKRIKPINPKLVIPSTTENMLNLMEKANLTGKSGSIDDSVEEDSNFQNIFDYMNQEELIEHIIENNLEADIPIKIAERMNVRVLRKKLQSLTEVMDEKTGDLNSLYEEDEINQTNELFGEYEVDFTEMNKQQLYEFSKENKIEISVQAIKNNSLPKLQQWFKNKWEEMNPSPDGEDEFNEFNEFDGNNESNEFDDEFNNGIDESNEFDDSFETVDFANMNGKELVAFAKEHKITVSKRDVTSIARLRKAIEAKYNESIDTIPEAENDFSDLIGDDNFYEEEETSFYEEKPVRQPKTTARPKRQTRDGRVRVNK